MEQVAAPVGEFITLLLKAFITLLVPVLTKLLYSFVMTEVKKLQFNIGDAQMAQLRETIAIVASAMEKSAMSGWIKDEAVTKKNEAIKVLQDFVDSKKLKIPMSVIEAELEHAIHLGLHKTIDGDVIGYDDERHMGFDSIHVTGVGVPVEEDSEEVEEEPTSRLGFIRNR